MSGHNAASKPTNIFNNSRNQCISTLKVPDLALLSGREILILENPGILMLESLGFPTDEQDIESRFHLESGLGSVKLDTTQWVEVWKHSGQPKRAERHGSRIHVCEATPPALPIRLGAFLEIDSYDDRDVVIDWEEFHRRLKEDLLETAISRYREMLKECYERENACRVKEIPSKRNFRYGFKRWQHAPTGHPVNPPMTLEENFLVSSIHCIQTSDYGVNQSQKKKKDPMADDNPPALVGRCHCGSVQYQTTHAPYGLTYCYCSTCRALHGAPFAAFTNVRDTHLRWTRRDTLVEKRFSAHATRTFCSECFAPLTMVYDREPGEVGIVAASVDEKGSRCRVPEVKRHIFVGEKVGWCAIGDRGERFEGLPGDMIGYLEK
ncbi:predicted protein [Uncinocarpus reesii 1704]|uniref:CENP-V/GFA domain-containing protein n=1 Tax=Uncinocarpus reesii (strain UAMH 1704) TaxID=336963 RepID=C4JTF0_UNCRE|nr:uncharacterized protein UREG_05739 [Uncinocarpus reesii 1704]EEP80897.1 predicted protein [Uncinocarpus reesii 1704]